jgi:hypothetical protein
VWFVVEDINAPADFRVGKPNSHLPIRGGKLAA